VVELPQRETGAVDTTISRNGSRVVGWLVGWFVGMRRCGRPLAVMRLSCPRPTDATDEIVSQLIELPMLDAV